MVSLWPWGREDTSPGSFEKTLSSLSQKINDTSVRIDGRRQRARRFKALWTLYSSFAYLLCLILEALVVGWRSWGPAEYSGLAGAPVIIYLVRLGLSTFYDYRISSLQQYLGTLQTRREKTITKLKAATRYDSTHELLEKYGGADKKSKTGKAPQRGESDEQQGGGRRPKPPHQGTRTSLPPPPTANIPGRSPPPQQQQQQQPSPPSHPQQPPSPAGLTASPQSAAFDPSASFAPNAFPPAPSYSYSSSQPQGGGGAWYDRLLDVLLGEDEASARSRLALICATCRLVNGLAPPGAKTLEAVGKWRCSGCGMVNGEESPDKKVLEEIERGSRLSEEEVRAKLGEAAPASPVSPSDAGRGARRAAEVEVEAEDSKGLVGEARGQAEESDHTVYSEEEGGGKGAEGEREVQDSEDEGEEAPQPARATRRSPKKGARQSAKMTK